jgi:hypothetical protein
MSESAATIAARITFIVERRWQDAEGVVPRDLNDVFVLLAILPEARITLTIGPMQTVRTG